MSGYSGKPLHQKLGLKPGQTLALLGNLDVETYRQLLGPDLPDVDIVTSLVPQAQVSHVFTTSRKHLKDCLTQALDIIPRDGMVWVSWPKKASGLPSEVTEDVIRDVCLPMGLVDVKVCAVNETFSALKLVIRKELR